MKRVFGWQTDTLACHLYRTVYPLTHLNASRWEYGWGAPGADIHDWDVVVGQRLTGVNDVWMDLCADPGVLAVYDLDDDLLNVDPENEVPYSIYAPVAADTARLIGAADVVTAATPRLAEKLRKLNPNVVVLPNCLHPDSLTARPLVDQRTPLVTVGWGGSWFHGHDWAGMRDQLAAYHARFPRSRFHMMGTDYTGLAHQVSGFTNMGDYLANLDFNIGIAPLKVCVFNESKSWCKLLEYASRGIPAVATGEGQYPEWVGFDDTGMVVRTMAEWVEALMVLSENPALREQMAFNAYKKACQFNIAIHAQRWEQIYEGNF